MFLYLKKLFAWGKIRRVILDATPFQLYEIYVTDYRIFHTVNSEKKLIYFLQVYKLDIEAFTFKTVKHDQLVFICIKINNCLYKMIFIILHFIKLTSS